MKRTQLDVSPLIMKRRGGRKGEGRDWFCHYHLSSGRVTRGQGKEKDTFFTVYISYRLLLYHVPHVSIKYSKISLKFLKLKKNVYAQNLTFRV